MILAVLAAAAVANAEPNLDRYLTIQEPTFEDIYDLTTVNQLQPGRFTITSRNMKSPDVIRLELALSEQGRTYCSRPPGQYDPDQELLIFGKADMHIDKVKVEAVGDQKMIMWKFPYKRATLDLESGRETESYFLCRYLLKSDIEEYIEWRNLTTNGNVTVDVFDCDHGLSGTLMRNTDDPDAAMMSSPRAESIGEDIYFQVCRAVNHKAPYAPNEK